MFAAQQEFNLNHFFVSCASEEGKLRLKMHPELQTRALLSIAYVQIYSSMELGMVFTYDTSVPNGYPWTFIDIMTLKQIKER